MATLTGIACYVPFGEYQQLNPESKGLHDKMMGLFAGYLNEFISDLGVNISIIGAGTMGACFPANRSCTGIRGLLESGKADFSLTSMQPSDLDPGHCFPHDYSPTLDTSETFISQMPDKPAESAEAGVLTFLVDIKPGAIIMLIATAVIAFFLLNIRLTFNGFVLSKRYKWIHVWQHAMMHPQVSFRSDPQRIVQAMMLLLLMWTTQMMQATAKGELTIITPAKYLKTMDEISDSNRSVVVWKGMQLDQYFSSNDDEVSRKIGKKMIREFNDPVLVAFLSRGALQNPDLILTHKQTMELQRNFTIFSRIIGLMETTTAAGNVAGWICHAINYKDQIDAKILRKILPSQSYGRMLGMSRNISRSLKHRLILTVNGLFELGITQQPISTTRVLDDYRMLKKGKMIPCFEAVFSSRDASDTQYRDLPMAAYLHFLNIVCGWIAVCFAVWLLEQSTHHSRVTRVKPIRVKTSQLASI
jgi:hypothetical protein